jgi:hypothetical protein
MPVKLTMKILGGTQTVTIEAENAKALFKEATIWGELPDKCPKDGSPLVLAHKTNKDGVDFYERNPLLRLLKRMVHPKRSHRRPERRHRAGRRRHPLMLTAAQAMLRYEAIHNPVRHTEPGCSLPDLEEAIITALQKVRYCGIGTLAAQHLHEYRAQYGPSLKSAVRDTCNGLLVRGIIVKRFKDVTLAGGVHARDNKH